MKLRQKLFPPRLTFQPIDPLGDGLDELIRREQVEQEMFQLDDEPDRYFWDEMVDIHEA